MHEGGVAMGVLVVVLLVVELVDIADAVWFYLQQRRSHELQSQFGPEYNRTVRETGDRGRAERELAARKEHVEKFQIQPLGAADQQRFAGAWKSTQARFVDDPQRATAEADQLIGEVMAARGYPVADFEGR